MALPTPIPVDDTLGGTEILAEAQDGYKSIFIRNLSGTQAVDYSISGEAPVFGSCLKLAANAELHITDAAGTGIGRHTSVKAIADAAQSASIYVEAIQV